MIIILDIPSICFIVAGILGIIPFLFMGWFVGVQSLRVFVPVPSEVTVGTAVLMLDTTDEVIYKHLIKQGAHARPCDNGCLLKYHGFAIYDEDCGQFEIGEKILRPHAIRVIAKQKRGYTNLFHKKAEKV